MDNINFYSNGIPAGQQTDSYTTQPGCLLSKNVDIFSSSKSIKATAFSEPVAGDSGVIASEGGLELRNDGKIYENGQVILDPSVNFPVLPVSYTGKNGTYANAEFGTPQDMSVAYEGDEWQSLVVFTDRTQYQYSKTPSIISKKVTFNDGDKTATYQGVSEQGYAYTKVVSQYATGARQFVNMKITIESTQAFSTMRVKFKATNQESAPYLRLRKLAITNTPTKLYYDNRQDMMMVNEDYIEELDITPSEGSIFDENGITVEVPVSEGQHELIIDIYDERPTDPSVTSRPYEGTLYIDMNQLIAKEDADDIEEQKKHTMSGTLNENNETYTYLSIRDRKIEEIGDYYWIKGYSYQVLNRWDLSWVEIEGNQTKRYDFVGFVGWEIDPRIDVITLISYKEQVYIIGNMNGNGYIIPGDMAGGTGVMTMFPGIQFLGGINKDYLVYLCGTDRGISTLWAYNGQELVPVVSGSQEVSSKDLKDNVEQYRFDGSMVIYRNNIVLGTTDNRLFRYGQTYGGRGGSFIYVLPDGAVLDKLSAKGNNLIVDYTLNQTKYQTIYQDDVPVKKYNTEYEVVYPIVIGNHVLEKEDTDLYVSYLLPSANTSLEFWAMNNHYQYWTFTSEENVTLDTTKNYTMAGAGGTYALKFIERNGNQYTFELDGNLPVQTSNEMKIKDNENTVVLNYTSYNHFRLIGTLSTDKCEESKFRFTGLNNKLNLTKTHSMQIMVKGKGTTQYTPELFALNLVATQRDRG